MNRLLKTGCWLLVLACVGALAGADRPSEETKQPGTPPKPLKNSPPVYPYRMQRAGLTGEVLVEFIVDTSGAVLNPYVVSSNNPWFERPALEAILKWKFSPAIVDGHAVNVRVRQPLKFEMDFVGGEARGLWEVARPGKKAGLPPELQWDRAPMPVNSAFPVYPLEALRAGKDGTTKIKFLVGPDGTVVSAQVLEATTPEMGAAALAMIDTWVFTPPAKKDGTPCYAALAIEHEFRPRGTGDVPVAPEALDILHLLEKSPEKIAGLAGLDAAPRPLSRRPPVYPSALRPAGATGTALIEFFIDKNGDAQLPHVISSSTPEFGYAAVQAVATWRFEPVHKGGKAVVTRVQIPIEFILPAAGKRTEP